MKLSKNFKHISLLLLSAFLYSFSVPLSKLFSSSVPVFLKTSVISLGAVIAMFFIFLILKIKGFKNEYDKFTKKEIPYLIIIVLTEILSNISLMYGLTKVNGDSASLLLSFLTIATFLFAIILFKEKTKIYGWIGLLFIFLGCVVVSIKSEGFNFNINYIFILIPCLLWGFQNNINRKLAHFDPKKIVIIKYGSTFIVTLIISLILKEYVSINIDNSINLLYLCILGFFAYGISLMLLIKVSKDIGAGIASCFFGINPVLGAILSIFICKETPYFTLYISIGFVLIGIIFSILNEYKSNNKTDSN